MEKIWLKHYPKNIPSTIDNLKFKRDDLINKLQLVSREEYNILKKIIEKQQKQIDQLRKKKTIKAKKS